MVENRSDTVTNVVANLLAPRSWWAWVLALGTSCYLIVLRTLLTTNNLNLVPSLLLLGSAVVPAAVLIFTWVRTGTIIPASVVVIVAFAGGVLGTAAAGAVEYDVLRQLNTLPMLAVALTEEAAKLIVPALVLLLSRNKWPRAGATVGVASAMGFASLETMGYGLETLLHTGQVVDVDQILLLRALISPACHIAWTGAVTAVLWRTRYSPHRRQAGIATIGLFVAVVILHTAWDSSPNLWVHVTVAAVSITGFLATMNTRDLPDSRVPISISPSEQQTPHQMVRPARRSATGRGAALRVHRNQALGDPVARQSERGRLGTQAGSRAGTSHQPRGSADSRR